MATQRISSRPRLDDTLLLNASAHLTDRDRYLLSLLLDHRVLTTTQIADVAFTSLRRAEARLQQLHRLRVLDTFRPFTRHGSAPHHWFLDTVGLHVLAAATGRTLESLLPARRHALALATSPRLNHTTGVNGFFTRLLRASRAPNSQLAAARYEPTRLAGGRLLTWWSERRCAQTWADYVRPDGHGVWTDQQVSVPFFLEFDTGTEPLTRLSAKIDGYTALAQATGTATVVLFVLGSTGRERNVHRLLRTARVPIATSLHQSDIDPSSRIWRPLHRPDNRLTLLGLAGPQRGQQPVATPLARRPRSASPNKHSFGPSTPWDGT